ncbi:WD40 repeat-like protein [Piromyces finnis]|uniref:WD40 repeat-like protein n=1 Tax=Piromyces finnis TaxID=1754191 RepID=A0A1Y1V9C9_9FUNG|nr:WD40 repeat-like protein [Piromyces finnis]|eukprot:ORX50388.1 WD40 repeat-like protein [Piromyces finnis]
MDSDSSEAYYDVITNEDFTVETKIHNIRDSIKRYSTNPLNLLIENKIKKQIEDISEENSGDDNENYEDEILNQKEIEEIKKSLSSINIEEEEEEEEEDNEESIISNIKEYQNDTNDNNEFLNPDSSIINKDNYELNCNGSVHNTINSTESIEVSLEKLETEIDKKSVSKKGWFFKKPRRRSKSSLKPKYNSDEALYKNEDADLDIFDKYYSVGPKNTMRISMSSDNVKSINSQMFDSVSSINSSDSDKHNNKNLKVSSSNKDSGRKLSSVSKKILSNKKKHSKYVNVRTKHKTVKEFNSLRFIQELGKLPTNMYPNSNAQDLNVNLNMNADDTSLNEKIGEGLKLDNGSFSSQSNFTPISEMKDIEGPIWALSFSKNGKYLASGGQDMIIRVWILYSEVQDYLSSPDINDTKQNLMKKKKISPVFRSYPYRYYRGHTSDILDLSWSKTDFLISSSMDKTVRLWHVMHNECLRIFQHEDFVTSIRFHPKDDRYFLSGSLDSKIRLWSIQEEKVVYWNDLSNDQLITSVGFSQDGSFAIAGTFQGDAIFYEFEKLKYNTQIKVCNPKVQKKITGIEPYPRMTSGPDSVLFTTTDSRIRLFQLDDKSCSKEYKGLTNKSGQIKASFSDDGKYIICGSEDRQVYIWNVEPPQTSRREMVEKLQNIIRGRDAMTINTYETFVASNSAVTATVFAPQRTRIILETANLRESKIAHMSVHTVMKNRSTKLKIANPADIVKNVAKPEKKRNNAVGMIIVSADFNGRIRVFENVIKPPKRDDKKGFPSFHSEGNLAALTNRKASVDETQSYNRIFSKKNKTNVLNNLPYSRSQEFGNYNSGNSSVCSSPYHRRPARAYSQSSMTNSLMDEQYNDINRSPYIMKSSMSVNMVNLPRGNSSASINFENQDSLSYSNDQNSSFSVCQHCNCAHSHKYSCPYNGNTTPSINENMTLTAGNANNVNNIVMLPPSSISAMDNSYDDSSRQNSQPTSPTPTDNNNNNNNNENNNNTAEITDDELKCSECGMNKFKLFKDGKVKCVNCMNEYAMKYSMPVN